MFIEIISALFVAFVGYAIGRFGHIFGGHLNTPHHWIYGLLLIVFGFIYIEKFYGDIILYFGTGHFISDFKDFLKMKFFGRDEDGVKKFWGID
jgi:hypothetical protein